MLFAHTPLAHGDCCLLGHNSNIVYIACKLYKCRFNGRILSTFVDNDTLDALIEAQVHEAFGQIILHPEAPTQPAQL